MDYPEITGQQSDCALLRIHASYNALYLASSNATEIKCYYRKYARVHVRDHPPIRIRGG